MLKPLVPTEDRGWCRDCHSQMSRTSEPEFHVHDTSFVPTQRRTYHLLKLRLVPLQALGILQKSRVGMVHLHDWSVSWQNGQIKDEFKTWRSNFIVWSKTLSRVITSSLGSCGSNVSFYQSFKMVYITLTGFFERHLFKATELSIVGQSSNSPDQVSATFR